MKTISKTIQYIDDGCVCHETTSRDIYTHDDEDKIIKELDKEIMETVFEYKQRGYKKIALVVQHACDKCGGSGINYEVIRRL